MSPREHAFWARRLLDACGGVSESARHLATIGLARSDTQLSRYQTAGGGSAMPADVIAALEAYCGQAIYSRAMVEAVEAAAVVPARLVDEACEAAEAASDFQREARTAAADGKLSEAEKRLLRERHAHAMAQLREAGKAIGAGDEGDS